MKKPILLIMAAGMGSRYGGLKQMDAIGPNGELILDYSIYDAIKVGFGSVIFVINKRIEKDFKEIVGNRISQQIRVDYAYQELTDVPENITLEKDRVKPLGTAHAVYSARNLIDAPFAVINADDFYGREAFSLIHSFLSSPTDDNKCAMVGYSLKNTVTDNGYVSRGVCSIDDKSNLETIVERTRIEKTGETIVYTENESETVISGDTCVSMNLWGFMPEFINLIEEGLGTYLEDALKTNPLKAEYYLPYVVDKGISSGLLNAQVMQTVEKWYGVTYKEDKENVVKAVGLMHEAGIYPENGWSKTFGVEYLKDICEKFEFRGEIKSAEPYGDGHINDTFKVVSHEEDSTVNYYILQRVNHEIFKRPDALMENIRSVTTYLSDIKLEYIDLDDYEVLELIDTISGDSYLKDELGYYWRAYVFVMNSTGYTIVENNEMLYEAGRAFGQFQHMLSDFPASELDETIKDFHHTLNRFHVFEKTLQNDRVGRKSQCENEIEFVYSKKSYMDKIVSQLGKEGVPLRVTHNDTKLNNVLLDDETGKARCVIDLDTVMSGSLLYDYGDAIRFCGSTEAEDSEALEELKVDMGRIESFTRGFLETVGDTLTSEEINLLPVAALIMTLECGMRFLTDFLEGDNYFKVHKENHNLIRAKNQFKFVAELEKSLSDIANLVETLLTDGE